MAEIVLFHHVLGLTPGCRSMAKTLSEAGHTVHTPDLFAGRTFTSIDDGVAYVDRIGFDDILDRGCEAVADLTAHLVYIGISLGAMPAQRLAQTRPGALGAVLLEACAPVDAFAAGWPAGVPVQVHGMDNDEFFAGEGDLENARRLVDQASSSGPAELHTYPGDSHLFVDSSAPGHDPMAAALVVGRILDFLGVVGCGAGPTG